MWSFIQNILNLIFGRNKVKYATKLRTLVGGGNFYSVAVSRNGTYIVVGFNQGNMYKSSDSGATWVSLPNAPFTTYNKLAISDDGNYIFAQPGSSYVYVSQNGGTSFTQKTNVTLDNDGLAMSASGQYGYLAGFTGYVYTTSDYGSTWVQRTSGLVSGPKHVMACSGDGQFAVTADYSGSIYTSSNFGANWTVRSNAGTNKGWQDGNMSDDGTKVAVSAYNIGVFTSTDSGANWTQRSPAKYFYNLQGNSDGTKMIFIGDNVSNTGLTEFWTTNDSGATWTQRTLGNLQDQWGQHSYGDIDCDGAGNFYVIVPNQFFKKSTDNGVTWQGLDSNTNFTKSITSMIVSGNGMVGFASGFPATGHFVSTDGLQNWTYGPVDRRNIIACSYDGSKVLGISHTATVYTGTGIDYPTISTDTGSTWTDNTAIGSREYYVGAMSDDGTTMFITSAGLLFRSQNTGSTWSQLSQTAGFWYFVACSSDASKVYAVDGNPGYIYTSTNSGTAFTQRTGPGSRAWEGVACSDDGSIAYAIADNVQMYKSTDSGATWNALSSTPSGATLYPTQVLCSGDGKRVFETVYDSNTSITTIYCSFDFGVTWTTLYTLGGSEYSFQLIQGSSNLRKIVYGVTSMQSGDLVEPKLVFMV